MCQSGVAHGNSRREFDDFGSTLEAYLRCDRDSTPTSTWPCTVSDCRSIVCRAQAIHSRIAPRSPELALARDLTRSVRARGAIAIGEKPRACERWVGSRAE